MSRRGFALTLIALSAIAGVIYIAQPPTKPVAHANPRLTPDQIEERQSLLERDGARRSARIQTGTGDAYFIAGEPLLIFPPREISRPTPNDGNTGSHWYTGEAATADQRK